jgi:hypothetical protein
MKKITFYVEIGKDGYSAWHVPAAGGIAAATIGDTFALLKSNAVASYNLLIADTNVKPITAGSIEFLMAPKKR